jgi:hypothetical protein
MCSFLGSLLCVENMIFRIGRIEAPEIRIMIRLLRLLCFRSPETSFYPKLLSLGYETTT